MSLHRPNIGISDQNSANRLTVTLSFSLESAIRVRIFNDTRIRMKTLIYLLIYLRRTCSFRVKLHMISELLNYLTCVDLLNRPYCCAKGKFRERGKGNPREFAPCKLVVEMSSSGACTRFIGRVLLRLHAAHEFSINICVPSL